MQRLEHAAVGVEAGRVQDGVLRVEEIRNSLFQLFVQVLGTADETDGGHAVSVGVHRFLGCFDETGRVGQAQVVVGAEVQGFGAVFKGDFGALGADDVAFVLVEAGLFDGLQLVCKVFLELSVHSLMVFVFVFPCMGQSYHFPLAFPSFFRNFCNVL